VDAVDLHGVFSSLSHGWPLVRGFPERAKACIGAWGSQSRWAIDTGWHISLR
jgi:hypothetical protein